MKTTVADWQYKTYCIRIVPVGAENSIEGQAKVIRLGGYPQDLVMSNGAKYITENGYEFTGISGESSFASTSVDMSGILSQGAVSAADLDSGLYDNARVYLFATSHVNPIEDEEPLALMFWGKVTTTDERYKVQLMGAIDALSQSPARTYGIMCPWVFLDRSIAGDKVVASRSRCTGPRSAPDGPDFDALIQTKQSLAEDRVTLVALADGQLDDYYGNGELQFTTGPNAGLAPSTIKSSVTSGANLVVVIHEPLQYAPVPGDMFNIIPGCRKRKLEDCKNKYNNVINNGSFPDIPAPTQYSQVGRQ